MILSVDYLLAKETVGEAAHVFDTLCGQLVCLELSVAAFVYVIASSLWFPKSFLASASRDHVCILVCHFVYLSACQLQTCILVLLLIIVRTEH